MSGYDRIKVYQTQEHPCSYLQHRDSQSVFIDPQITVDRKTFTYLSEMGFRRSGDFIYRPNCKNCESCISTRIPIQEFKPSRSHRRIIKRNADLEVRLTEPALTNENYQLFSDYIYARHADGDMFPPSEEMFDSFLVQTRSQTEFLQLYLGDELIAVSVVDQLDNALSAIYTFFSPNHEKRSLGTYCILQQLELASARDLDYLYLGYWVKECQKMAYKIQFRPIELLINEQWRSLS